MFWGLSLYEQEDGHLVLVKKPGIQIAIWLQSLGPSQVTWTCAAVFSRIVKTQGRKDGMSLLTSDNLSPPGNQGTGMGPT